MTRVAQYPIEPMFLHRWSPRAMNGQPLSEESLWRLFEAAHWAPSGGNSQSWRFVYAIAGEPEFAGLFDLLADGNKLWCERAGALLVVLSQSVLENGRANPTHAFDAGAAWMSLALQGSAMGLVVHGMAGFDAERARVTLDVPDNLAVNIMIAVGHPGRVEDLPEKLRPREQPSLRRPVSELAFKGRFPR
ncbi:MAG: nitroreductase family protein [Deltaproteobacteria bacterium]|nr:nitroreductase family protein [Deltaproteobacteria bacterium]